MKYFISANTFIAIATFLWYRKGRLWNFYDSLLSDSKRQIKTDSIDRKSWEKMALDQCEKLSKELFNSLFRFETKYLKTKIRKNQHCLWIADSSNNGEKQRTYTDKERYCEYKLEKIFLSDFRFCGFFLFINSIRHQMCVEKDKSTGYTEEKSK